VAAGSCITKEVPEGSLALGRSQQVVKEGWATARRALLKANKQSRDSQENDGQLN
jgi:bifunctional UDP-N-acetylglucosamine pyrophosphorylase/glucosamine-1-phosphate N-acetyltransferase